MKEFFYVILGAVIVIVGEIIRGRFALKARREEMEETHRRDAAAAALKIMEIAPLEDKERNRYVKHYGMVYAKLLRLLRAPEE